MSSVSRCVCVRARVRVCVQDKFKTGLLSSSEDFKREVTALLEEFRAKGPFASHIACAKAFEIISGIKQQVAQLKEDESALRRGLAIFKIDLPPSKDIAKLETVSSSSSIARRLIHRTMEAYVCVCVS